MNKTILQQLNQRPIAYYPVYRQLTGSTTAGILLSQMMYWFSKSDKFYKTDKEMIAETLLTENELRTAKKALKKLDFIKITREGLPAKTYYSIDWEKFEKCLNNQISEINETSSQKQTSSVKSTDSVSLNPQSQFCEIHETGSVNSTNLYKNNNLITETTTETTNIDYTENKKNIKKSFLLEVLENYNIQLLLKEMKITKEQLAELLAYRKELKKEFKTIRGVIALLRNIQATMRTHGKSFDKVFEIMAENEWQSIKPEWVSNLEAAKRQSGQKKDIVEANMSEAQKAIAMRKARLASQGA